MSRTPAHTFWAPPGRSTAHRRTRSRRSPGSTLWVVHGHQQRHAPVVGLPEVVGFAIGAGVMATALAALEAGLAGNERARRLARDGGVLAELERAAAERGWRHVPLPREVPGRQKSWASS